MRQAAATYNVPKSTLHDRLTGKPARRDCEPNSRKLTPTEELVIIKHILDLDSRGKSPNFRALRDMANRLLRERAAPEVGINWPSRFIQRKPELKTRVTRKYDYQRAKCEDPRVIGPYFDGLEKKKEEYGIQDEDTYNFDESGFQMGVVVAEVVITASERRSAPKKIQPGNREWATLIACINAAGWAIPPFLILAATYHLSSWYQEGDLPFGWSISTSSNGWTTNELGMKWLDHFDKHTKARTVGTHRLLILDGHESHRNTDFDNACMEKNIVPYYMPSHSSHLLQPLDLGCFAPLKKAYGLEVDGLAKNHIYHMTKVDFIPAFKAAYKKTFTKENILGSFRGAGIVPFDPEVVLSKLDIRLRTPTPRPTDISQWASQTPSNAVEIEAQSTLLCNKIKDHRDSSPASILDALESFKKGAEMIMHSQVLLTRRVAELEKANEAVTRRRSHKRKRIQKEGTLTSEEGQRLAALKAFDAHSHKEGGRKRARADGGEPTQRRCKRCGETGHNSCTCKQEEE